MANRITTLFDFKEQGSGLSKIKADMDKADTKVGKLKAGWKSAISEFARSPAAIGAATAAVGAFAAKAISDASDLEESINAVNKMYGGAAEEVHKLGEASAQSFGMSQTAFNNFSVQFSAFAKQIARESGRDVVEVLEEMTTRTADFASVQNLELEEAGRVVMSTLAGETEAFRRYGGDVSAATVANYAYAEGIAESGSELTEQQKVLARHGLFLEQTRGSAGDFKDTQEDLANATRTLNAQVNDLSASIGSVLAPELAEAVTEINDLVDAMNSIPLAGEAVKATVASAFDFTPFALTTKLLGEADSKMRELAGATEEADVELKIYNTSIEMVEDSIARSAEAQKRSARDAVLSNDDVTKSVREVENSIQLAKDRAHRFGADGVADFGRVEDAADDTADAVDGVEEAFSRMLGDISADAAWIGIEESFVRVQAEMAETGTVSARTANDIKRDVIELAQTVDNIPPSKVVEINALIDHGRIAEAERVLAQLARNRDAVIRAKVIVSGGTQSDFANPTGIGHTGRRVTPGESIQPLSGEAFLADRPGRVISREDLASTNGHGNAPSNVVVHAPITIRGEMTDPAVLEQTLRRAGATIGRTLNDVLEEWYRNGGRQPRSIR